VAAVVVAVAVALVMKTLLSLGHGKCDG